MREEVLYVIFLNLTKAYDALDRSSSLEILKGYGVGVTQGNPLSPTIFNVVVDVVVRHWVTQAVTDAEPRGERGREGRHQAALFYAENGMVASSDPQWLQWAFTQLVGLFDQVGLKTNTGKTVSMTCRPCTAAGNR